MSGKQPAAFVISLTPFTADGVFDEDAFRAHLRRLAAAGIGVYVAGSGTGEAYTLSRDETERVLHIAVEELKGKVPIRAMGCEPRVAEQMIEFVRMAQDAGVDAVQIYSLDPGHMYTPTGPEIERYISTVMEHVTIPAVVSTHMSVGYMIPHEVVGRLLDRFDQILGMTVTTRSNRYFRELVAAYGSRLEIISPNVIEALFYGAAGYAGSEFNLAPKLAVEMGRAFAADDLPRFVDAWKRNTALVTVLHKYGYVTGLKGGLMALGLPGGYPRLPRLPVAESALPQLRTELLALEIPEMEEISHA